MRNREWSRITFSVAYLVAELFVSSVQLSAAPSVAPVEPRKLKPTDGSSLGRDEIVFTYTSEDYLKQHPAETPLGFVTRTIHGLVSVKGQPDVLDPDFRRFVTLFYSSEQRQARPFFSQVIVPALEQEKKSPTDSQSVMEAARIRDVVRTVFQVVRYRLMANQYFSGIQNQEKRDLTDEEISIYQGLWAKAGSILESLYSRYPRFKDVIQECFKASDLDQQAQSVRQDQALASVDQLIAVSGLDPQSFSPELKMKFLSFDSVDQPVIPLYSQLWERAQQPGGAAEVGLVLTGFNSAFTEYQKGRDKLKTSSDRNYVQTEIHRSLGTLFDSIDQAAAKVNDPVLAGQIRGFGDQIVPDFSYQAGLYIPASVPGGIRFEKGSSVVLDKGPHAGMLGYLEMTRGRLTSFVVEGNAPTGQYEVRRFGMRVNQDGSLEGLGWVSRETRDLQTGEIRALPLSDLDLREPAPSQEPKDKPSETGSYWDVLEEAGSAVLEYGARPLRYVAGMVSVSAGSTIAEFRPSSGSKAEAISLGLIEWGTSTMGETGLPSVQVLGMDIHKEPTQVQYAMSVIPDQYMTTYSNQLTQSREFYRTSPLIAAGIDQETVDQVFIPMVMGFQGIDDQAVMHSLYGWDGQQVRWSYEADFARSQGRVDDADEIVRLATGAAWTKFAGEVLFVSGLGGGPVRWVMMGSSRGPVMLGAVAP